MLTFEQIKELIELVGQNRLQGVELERSGFRLKIDGQQQAQTVAMAAPAAASAAAPAPAAAPAAAPMAEAAPAAVPAATAPAGGPPPGHTVTSPIVGTFYRSASPDSPPFVEVGSQVKKGQPLCIIEAMKLMNEIESDIDGVVTMIYPQNAQAVEYGEPLFVIK